MSDLVAEAATAAERAAADAGVRVRVLTELAELRAVRELYDRIWRRGDAGPLLALEQLRAMASAGNYVAGAYAGAELVGACVGFFAAPVGESLHSHVAGVSPAARGRSVGFALKQHQRAWALAQGLREVRWTFDPLVRRNAYFNLVKLAARPREYLVDFYGELDDAVNAGQGSDRLLVVWDLTAPEVVAAAAGAAAVTTVDDAVPVLIASAAGRPVRVAGTRAGATLLVGVPAEVEQLRADDPDLAREWRLAVREVLGGLMAGGAEVRGFDTTGGYVVRHRPVTDEGSRS